MKRIAFALFLVVLPFLISCGVVEKYDELISKDENCAQMWADYDAQLQRRADLIPNLVEVVKASATYENKVLTEVTEARASATQIKLTGEDLSDPDKVAAFEHAQSQLKGSLSRLMMVQEQYPDLKANSAFHDLQIQIEGTENRILRARTEYNKAVGSYNIELKRLSGKILNPVTGHEFKPRVYFQADPGTTTAPKVNFAPPVTSK